MHDVGRRDVTVVIAGAHPVAGALITFAAARHRRPASPVAAKLSDLPHSAVLRRAAFRATRSSERRRCAHLDVDVLVVVFFVFVLVAVVTS